MKLSVKNIYFTVHRFDFPLETTQPEKTHTKIYCLSLKKKLFHFLIFFLRTEQKINRMI